MKNIHKTIIDFYNNIKSDPNHRYKSWEHCYSYFKKPNIDIDIACLHLSFYLASWGMYRGSSPLLWKDYLIHKEVVKEIIKYKDLQKFNGNDNEILKIIKLKDFIRNYYSKVVLKVNGIKKDYKPSDVLISKILLGTLGCVPAFDRYFIDGIKMKKIKPFKFNEKSINKIFHFYKNNEQEFIKAKKYINQEDGINYPIMKLVDMYFWQLGYKKIK